MTRRRNAFLLAFIPALAMPAWGETITIADLAPKEAALVVGTDSFSAMKASFDKTPLRSIWEDPKVKEFVKKYSQQFAENLSKDLESAGFKLDELGPPSGAAGAAFWITWDSKANKVEPAMLAMGDWGDKADAVSKQIEEAIAKGEEKKSLKVTEDEYAGHKLWVIEETESAKADKAKKSKEDKKAAANDGAEGDDAEADEGEEALDAHREPPMEFKKIVYSHSGSHLLASGDTETMERALDRLAGKASPSVGEADAFAGVVKQLDKPQAYAVILSGSPLNVLDKMIDAAKAGAEGVDPGMGAEPRMTKVLEVAGVSGVKAAGVGMKFDTESGMAEMPMAVLCPDKKGLMSLLNAPEQKFAAPPFATADAASVSLLQFKLADLLPTIIEAARALPPEAGDMVVQYVQQAQLMSGPILSNLGPQVWMVSTINKPLAADSGQQLFAVQLKDAAQFNQSLQNLGGMLPLQSRDFQGNQIWSISGGMPMGGAADFAIGVGFGHVFIGPGKTVENAMRQAGNPDAAGLDKEERFRKAIGTLKGSGLMFGWTDTARTFEYVQWMFQNPDKMVEAQMKGMFGDDPDAENYKKEMIDRAKKNQPEWMKAAPIDVLAREMGDAVTEMRSTTDGFEGRVVWLRPAKK